MKRYKNLWDNFISMENLELAAKKAVRSKKNKPETKFFLEHKKDLLIKLQQMLKDGVFNTSQYKIRRIFEPKERYIYILPLYPDHIVHHALINILGPIWQSTFIKDSYACIPGKGLHAASVSMMRFMRKYKYVLQFDGDGQHRPVFIKGMLDVMEQEGINVVIGSRFVTQKKPHTLRMLGNNLISLLLQISTGQTITDPTSGLRIYSREVIEEFSRNINYAPEPDTISYLIKCGMKVKELQVEMDERVAGESYLTLARSMKYMTLQCFSIVFIQAFRRRIK